MNWSRQYRPYQIAGLHLISVRKQMEALLKQGTVPQALLFAGPKGTGKTSASRILGAVLNDPRNEDAVEALFFNQGDKDKAKLKDIDDLSELGQKILSGESYIVQEMDAASNRGIDDIRDLKERLMLPPQEGKISVYILDEAHMLTTPAFNALLKILEEPPEHVVFILATTEMHKVPDTIISRCQVIHFRRASLEEIVTALKDVLTAEKLEYQDQALQLIAERADGSFRDAIKLLEVAAGEGEVTVEAVETFVASNLTDEIKTLLSAVVDKDKQTVVSLINQLRSENVDPDYFYQQLMKSLHQQLEKHFGLAEGEPYLKQSAATFLLSELLDESFSLPTPIAHLPLEIKLLEIINRAKKNGDKTGKKKGKKVTQANKNPTKVVAETITPPKQTEPIKQTTPIAPDEVAGEAELLLNNWHQFISQVAEENSTIAALLQSAQPLSAENGRVSIGVYYQFHQEQLSSKKFISIAKPIISQLCQGSVELAVVLTSPPTEADLQDPKGDNSEKIPALAQVATEALM